MLLFAGDALRSRVEADRTRSLEAVAAIQRSGNAGRDAPETLARRLSIRLPTLFVGSETVDVTCAQDGRTVAVRFSIPFEGDAEYLHASQGEALDDDDVEVDGSSLTLSLRIPSATVGRDAPSAARGVLDRHDDVVGEINDRLGAQVSAVEAANGDIRKAIALMTVRAERARAMREGLELAMTGREAVPAAGRDVEGFEDEGYAEADDAPPVPLRMAGATR